MKVRSKHFMRWESMPRDPRFRSCLPVGISFYTFQTMSYTIDVYRKKLRATGNFLDFALFVTFFPQLVAGPIERATHLLPLIQQKRVFSIDETVRGLFLILLGLVKKMAIADGVSGAVAAVYGSQSPVSGLDVVLATYAFAFQILCDFSAYTDIARGSSKLLGIDLMINFNAPYFAKSPSDFWQRWHISLSTWLRDYLYIPLGGNRFGSLATYRNLMITMVLGGLWHGAAWNFVLWGIYQGAVLCLFRLFQPMNSGRKPSSTPTTSPWARLAASANDAFQIILYFQITCYGWLLFRSDSFSQIKKLTSSLFTAENWFDAVDAPSAPERARRAGLSDSVGGFDLPSAFSLVLPAVAPPVSRNAGRCPADPSRHEPIEQCKHLHLLPVLRRLNRRPGTESITRRSPGFCWVARWSWPFSTWRLVPCFRCPSDGRIQSDH